MAKKINKLNDLKKIIVDINSERKKLLNFRFQKALQQLEHPQKLRHVKKNVARVKTFIRELELGIKK